MGSGLTAADADQVGAWARDRLNQLVTNAVDKAPAHILADPSAAGFLAAVYRDMDATEARALVAYAVVVEAQKRLRADDG